MNAARSVNFLQIDNEVKSIAEIEGVVLMPSPEAYRKLRWTRQLYKQEPKGGYFIWVKDSPQVALSTCMELVSPRVDQTVHNLVVVEETVSAKMNGLCCSVGRSKDSFHRGHSRIFLKEGSFLEIEHQHRWRETVSVEFEIEFVLSHHARIVHSYRCFNQPQELKARVETSLEDESSANFELAFLAKQGKVEVEDVVRLKGNGSRATSRLKLVAREKSQILARSRMLAEAESFGHVDCLGLLVEKDASIRTIPELYNRHHRATLTHEASVGQIAGEALDYLRTRGLTKAQAIDLVVNGFLK